MIDREARDEAALLLRRFAAGRITNFEFDDAFPRSAADAALRAIGDRAWQLYDDIREHRLTPSPELRREIARWIVFLHSDSEYRWPRFPFIGVRAPGWLNWLSGGRLHRRHEERFRQWAAAGDFAAWPFFSAAEATGAASRPRYLTGTDR
jgi:hypothetical protein